MIRTFQGIKPTIPPSCFIEETGIVIGNVGLGEHCSVSFHAVIRGDPPHILIFSIPLEGEEASSLTARNFLTRPPTGTPRRAISPSEALLIFCTSL